MKYKCINAVGYEGRLKEGIAYNTGPCGDPDFLFIVFDDGTTGEVFRERFEKEPFVVLPKVAHKEQSKKNMANRKFDGGSQEGKVCECGNGTYELQIEGCTCHLGHPPCRTCVDSEPTCTSCMCMPKEASGRVVFPKALLDRVTIDPPENKVDGEDIRAIQGFIEEGLLSKETATKVINKKLGLATPG